MQTLLLLITILVIIIALLLTYGAMRWRTASTLMLQALEGQRQPLTSAGYDPDETSGLPAPVQAFFQAVLTERQPVIGALTLEHAGDFNLSESGHRWRPFVSTQRIITRQPGFDWDARMHIVPGAQVRVHDAYIAGEGILHASLFGLFSLAELRGTPAVAQGELLRFLAEAVWHPTSLLPRQGVAWEAIDDRSARATLNDGDIQASLVFRFDAEHRVESVHAESRPRLMGQATLATPWEGRFWNYEKRDGMAIPLDAEVAWLLEEGRHPYWRGRITRITYEFDH